MRVQDVERGLRERVRDLALMWAPMRTARTWIASAALLGGSMTSQGVPLGVPLYFRSESAEIRTSACAEFDVVRVRRSLEAFKQGATTVADALSRVVELFGSQNLAALESMSYAVGPDATANIRTQLSNYISQFGTLSIEEVRDVVRIGAMEVVFLNIKARSSGKVSPATLVFINQGGRLLFMPEQPNSLPLSMVRRWYLANAALRADPLSDTCNPSVAGRHDIPLTTGAPAGSGRVAVLSARGAVWSAGFRSDEFLATVQLFTSALAGGDAGTLKRLSSDQSFQWLSAALLARRSSSTVAAAPAFWFDLGDVRVVYAAAADSGKVDTFFFAREGGRWLAKGLGSGGFSSEIFTRKPVSSLALESPPFGKLTRPTRVN